MKKILVLIAAILAAPLGHCEATPSLKDVMSNVHTHLNRQLEPGDTVLLGDSITQYWKTNQIERNGVNFAVASSTSADVLKKIDQVSNLCVAGNAQIMTGINDIHLDNKHPRQLMINIGAIGDKLNCANVTWIGILHPTRADFTPDKQVAIDKANSVIRAVCASMAHCRYIAPPRMFKSYLSDGLHPNKAGYAVLNARIRSAQK